MKFKLMIIIGVLVSTLFVAQISLFDILYPAIGDPDFETKRKLAMQQLAWIRIFSSFALFSYFGWFTYELYKKFV